MIRTCTIGVHDERAEIDSCLMWGPLLAKGKPYRRGTYIGVVRALGQFDLMQFSGVLGPSVWVVIRIAEEVFAEAYKPKGREK